MKHVWEIARKEFSDRLRSGWVLACVLVWLGAITLTSLFGLVQIGRIGLQGYERTVASLLSLVQYVVPLLGLLLGHDLIVSEREERTLALLVASGVRRTRVLAGKLFGGSLTLGLPLILGFTIAGTAIRLAAEPDSLGPFLKLAASGLALGIVFLAVGLLISTFCRTRVQALVLALLTWCAVVFVWDLSALGLLVVARSPEAARQVETVTDATHVNAVADMHAAFERGDDAAARAQEQRPRTVAPWLLANPVDLFRTVNLPKGLVPAVPPAGAAASILLWLSGSLLIAAWRINRLDA